MYNRVDAVGGQRPVGQVCQCVDAEGQQVGQPGADDAEGQPEHQRHDADKAGQRGVFAGQDLVDRYAALMLAALTGAHNGLITKAFNKIEPHIGQRGLAVKAGLALQFGDRVGKQLGLVFVKVQRFFNQRVTLDQLGGCKADGQPGAGGMVLDQMVDGMDAAMHRAALAVPRIAEVDAAGGLAVAGYMQHMLHQLVNALVFRGGDRYDRHAQQLLQRVDHDGAAVGADLVHHVQRQHQRDVQLHQLHRQVKVALNIGRIYDVDDGVRVGVEQKVAGDDLLA